MCTHTVVQYTVLFQCGQCGIVFLVPLILLSIYLTTPMGRTATASAATICTMTIGGHWWPAWYCDEPYRSFWTCHSFLLTLVEPSKVLVALVYAVSGPLFVSIFFQFPCFCFCFVFNFVLVKSRAFDTIQNCKSAYSWCFCVTHQLMCQVKTVTFNIPL